MSPYSQALNSPVIAVGGVGGSGTRVIAQILIEQGFYLGSDLNRANDNLWFTLLFKQPQWFFRNAHNHKAIFKALDIFAQAMEGRRCSSPADLGFIASAALRSWIQGNSHVGDGRGTWPLQRAWKMARPPNRDRSQYPDWGWKEPNSHIYLEFLNAHFKQLKFIQVIRHGLDMAWGNQQHQLFNWAQLYDVTLPRDANLVPRAALSYWVRANQRAIRVGREMGKEKFLLLNFDNLCASPAREIDRLLSFVDRNPAPVQRQKLCALVHPPATLGRYRKQDLGVVDSRDVEAVCKLGFTVEASA